MALPPRARRPLRVGTRVGHRAGRGLHSSTRGAGNEAAERGREIEPRGDPARRARRPAAHSVPCACVVGLCRGVAWRGGGRRDREVAAGEGGGVRRRRMRGEARAWEEGLKFGDIALACYGETLRSSGAFKTNRTIRCAGPLLALRFQPVYTPQRRQISPERVVPLPRSSISHEVVHVKLASTKDFLSGQEVTASIYKRFV